MIDLIPKPLRLSFSILINILEDNRFYSIVIFFSILCFLAPLYHSSPDLEDDLFLFSTASNRNLLDVLIYSHSLEGGTAFYRPIVDGLTHLILKFGPDYDYFIAFQSFLVVLFFVGLHLVFTRLALANVLRVFILSFILSSKAIWDAALWWSNMGSMIIIVAFLYSIAITVTSFRLNRNLSSFEIIILLILSAISVLSKENGLVLPAVLSAFFLFYKKYARSSYFVALIVTYFIYREFGVDLKNARPFFVSSGFMFSFYESSELREIFHGNSVLFYSYNVLSQFIYSLLSLPVDGWVPFKGWSVIGASVYLTKFTLQATLLFLAIRNFRNLENPIIYFLCLSILLNAIVSFPYARQRIMLYSAISYPLILSIVTLSLYVVTQNIRVEIKRVSYLFSIYFLLIGVFLINALLSLKTVQGRYTYEIHQSDSFISKDFYEMKNIDLDLIEKMQATFAKKQE